MRYLRLVWVALALLAPAGLSARAEEPVAQALLFYSRSCSHCQTVLQEVLPPIQAKYGRQLEVRQLELSEQGSYDLLLNLERRYQPSKRELPVLFVGERALAGEDEVRAELDREIAGCLARGGCKYPGAESAEAAGNPSAAGKAPIHLAYFYTRGCGECDRVSYDLDYLKSRYPGLVVTAFDVGAPDNKALNEALGRRLGVPESQRLLTPAVFVGQDYLVGPRIQASTLAPLLDRYAPTGAGPTWESLGAERQEAERSIADRFRSFGVVPVLAAGLVDGLNPCAFATMIFFVSYLAVAGRKGKDVIFVGAAFTAGVFLAYLAIGLGLATALKSLAFLVTLAKAVYLATAVVCFGLAVLSVRDYLRVRRGQLADMALQLPGFLKARIHATIRERARVRRFVLAAFVSGVIISFLELLCTGQIYLPTIVFVVGMPELRAQASLYLVLYNLMFVVPLVAVFLLTYFGTTSRDFTKLLQRQAAGIKLLMAAVFLMLGGWLAYAAL